MSWSGLIQVQIHDDGTATTVSRVFFRSDGSAVQIPQQPVTIVVIPAPERAHP